MGPPGHSGSRASGRGVWGRAVCRTRTRSGPVSLEEALRLQTKRVGHAWIGAGSGGAPDRPPEASRAAQVQRLAREGGRRGQCLRDPVHFG